MQSAGRHWAHRHEDARRGFRRASLFIASTHAYILILHQPAAVLLAQGERFPTSPAAAKASTSAIWWACSPANVPTMLAVRDLEEKQIRLCHATMAQSKRDEVKDFSHVMQRVIITPSISKLGMSWLRPRLTDGNQIVFLASHDGQAIRFDEKTFAHGTQRTGVRGMNLARRIHRRHGHYDQAGARKLL